MITVFRPTDCAYWLELGPTHAGFGLSIRVAVMLGKPNCLFCFWVRFLDCLLNASGCKYGEVSSW
jgi:hypothetical protein